ncbi:hypothetical protein GEMRC1_012468 [Eukaryota sp. GEM-RC1]
MSKSSKFSALLPNAASFVPTQTESKPKNKFSKSKPASFTFPGKSRLGSLTDSSNEQVNSPVFLPSSPSQTDNSSPFDSHNGHSRSSFSNHLTQSHPFHRLLQLFPILIYTTAIPISSLPSTQDKSLT